MKPFDLFENESAIAPTVNETHFLARVRTILPGVMFEMYIPGGWAIEANFPPALPGSLAPIPLCVFIESKKEDPALISVVGYRLNMEVNLQDWVDHILAKHQAVGFGGQWRQTPNGICWDIGVVEGGAPDQHFSRVTAYAASGIVYLITGRCRGSHWEKFNKDFLASNLSFEVLDTPPEEVGRLEPWLDWAGQSPPRMQTSYPACWKLADVPTQSEASDEIDFKLLDRRGEKMLAYVRLRLTAQAAANTPEVLFRQSVDRLREAGFSLALEDMRKLTEDSYVSRFPGHEGAWNCEVDHGDMRAEISIGIRSLASRFAVAISISAPRRERPIVWMRSKRAFEIVLTSLRC